MIRLMSRKQLMFWAMWGVFSCLAAGCAVQSRHQVATDVVHLDGPAGSSVILNQGVPVGSVVSYVGTLPSKSREALAKQGWLLCDGAAVSRQQYASLFAVLGEHHGAGDGLTSFNLPDFRGLFLRGVSGASGRDPDADKRTAAQSGGLSGNTVGTMQGDAVGLHMHDEQGVANTEGVYAVVGSLDSQPGMREADTRVVKADNGTQETRPSNVSVYYLVFAGLAESSGDG